MSIFVYCLGVVATWGMLSLMFVGWGFLFRRLLGYRLSELQDVFVSGWLGWACVVALLQIWHCFWPVNTVALLIVSVVGCVGVVHSGGQMLVLVSGKRRLAVLLLGGGALVAFWLANHSVMQPAVYDSGLYHLNAVRWNYTYPVVPGLGNLHGRLGYNNASLLYSALLDAGPFTGRSHHIASGWLILWMLMRCMFAGYELFKRGNGPRIETMYYALLAAPVLAWTVNSGYASSHSPDVVCFVLGIATGGELMAMSHFEGASGNCARSRFINIVFLSAASIAVKLSLLVYGLSICSVALLVLMADQASPREVWRPIGIALVLTSVVLVPWCVRGVILTGCPAYPATVMRFDLEWSVSEASAKTMVMHIKAWARAPWDAPETVLAGWGWFRPWLERTLATNVFDVRFPLMTVLLAKAIFWLQISRKECIELRHCVLLCMPAVLALGFWFWSAPDPRFLGSISWVLAATLLVLALQHKRAWSLPLILSHSVMVLAGCVNPIDVVRAYKDTSVAQQVPMATRVTRSGLSVYVPVDGDQSWDAELPSTPYFTARLALRDSSDLSKGFVKGPLMRKEGE